MLNLHIDFKIFVDFIKREPTEGVLNSNFNENEKWNCLWKFLKIGCNLTILNTPEITEINRNNLEFRFLSLLTTGREKSKMVKFTTFKKPFKNTFDLKNEFQSIFFLNEDNPIERENYLKKNPIPIGFMDGYVELFDKISLGTNESIVKPIGKVENENFSWDIIKDYFHYVTDIVLVDNFILNNKSIVKSNFFEIVRSFNAINHILNLTIVTFENEKGRLLNFETENKFIRDELNRMGITCKLNLILLTKEVKEHDRGIFTNFLRLKSGDSFNFVNSIGKIITKGTELDFYPLTNQNLFEVNDIALKAIVKKINKTPIKNKSDIIENRLLDFHSIQ